jgi:glutathione S-transferase
MPGASIRKATTHPITISRAVELPSTTRASRPGAEAALDFIDKSLAGRQWLVGDHCTIADLGCFGRLVFMAEGSMSLDNRPHAAAWRERIMAMPGFALPYDLIPKKDAEFG